MAISYLWLIATNAELFSERQRPSGALALLQNSKVYMKISEASSAQPSDVMERTSDMTKSWKKFELKSQLNFFYPKH